MCPSQAVYCEDNAFAAQDPTFLELGSSSEMNPPWRLLENQFPKIQET